MVERNSVERVKLPIRASAAWELQRKAYQGKARPMPKGGDMYRLHVVGLFNSPLCCLLHMYATVINKGIKIKYTRRNCITKIVNVLCVLILSMIRNF